MGFKNLFTQIKTKTQKQKQQVSTGTTQNTKHSQQE